jgi:branched-chain amino acid transport system substrate-binding protein
MAYEPTNRTEGQIYTKYMLAQKPGAKLGILYQNDDFGKDYPLGVKDVLGDKYGSVVVKEASYEETDASVDSQVVALQASGADVLLVAATPKFAVQAIQKVHDLNWHPTFFLDGRSSFRSVRVPAGTDKGIGIITAGWLKDSTYKDDPGMSKYQAFMAKYLPGADITDVASIYAYGVSVVMLQVLKQCDGDFSRANIMKQAANLHDAYDPVLLPGIKVNTSSTNFHPIRAMQLLRWTGKTWERFGDVIEGAS